MFLALAACTDRGAGPPPAAELVGGGWFFGFCGGLCRADLEVNGTELLLTLRDNSSEGTLGTMRGRLTSAGVEWRSAAAAGLGAVRLEETYGCPDCSDGGGGYVTLRRDGSVSRHTYDLRHPPRLLGDADRFVGLVIDALMKCRSTTYVEPSEDCVPLRS